MPEYIYLLENRLTPAQQRVLKLVRDTAREAGMTVFLAGGAVRDLTTGSSVRNFNFSVQGNALDLEAALVATGAEVWGKHEPTRTLSLWFPGSVRADVASTRSEEYPKPGKPVYHWNTIVEDLRRRDFTANAMALSLNEGSYGLLLDPLNGVADIEARLLRVASNYGFIEDPSRLVRAARLKKRLGWQFEDRTATRFANAKEAESIKHISAYLRGYELEKIASEEDPLDTVKALEAEGLMEHLFAPWTSAKADVAGLENLRKNWIQLLMQGVIADLTVAHLELLTSGLAPGEKEALKKALVHPGLVHQWEGLDESAKEFAKQLTGKGAAQPSAAWKLFTTHPAEPILWLAHTRKTGSGSGGVEAKFKSFFTVWPEFKRKVPAALMLEMRITPELPGYADLLEQLFYQLIDGNLETDEQMRAFLEPWSPPAPPPVPTVRRSRAKKSESKTKRRISAPEDEDDEPRDDDEDEDADDLDDVEDAEEEEIVEDDALSTVLEKLHGDEIAGDADAEADDAADDDLGEGDLEGEDDGLDLSPKGRARQVNGGSDVDFDEELPGSGQTGKVTLAGSVGKGKAKESSESSASTVTHAAAKKTAAKGADRKDAGASAKSASATQAAQKTSSPASEQAAKKTGSSAAASKAGTPAKPAKKH